jgi:hypothetical protein
MTHHPAYSAGQTYLGSLRKGWFPVLIGGAVVLGIYLFIWHQAHLFSLLPLLIILACPLMHVFGHRHGHKHPAGKPDKT